MSHVENKIQTFHQVKCLISYIYETKVWILFKFGFRRKSKSLDLLGHSFATHLMEAGVDSRYIQALLGHRDARSTQLYLHTSNKAILGIASPFDRTDGDCNV